MDGNIPQSQQEPFFHGLEAADKEIGIRVRQPRNDIRGEDGQPVPPNPDNSIDIGDLLVRGPSAALMYWHGREKSREAFQGAWTRSGDKYTRNADGYYTYAGHNDDMLKVSGVYVSPFEIEATSLAHLNSLPTGTPGSLQQKRRAIR